MSRGAAYSIIVLFALSFLLAGGSYWLSVRTVEAQVKARASVVQLCRSGNEARAQQVTLWTHLVEISRPPPGETPAARAQREDTTRVFLAYVHQVFAPRNCAAQIAGP